MGEITLSNGDRALVDDDLVGILSVYRWHCNGYAYRQERRKTIYMHREVAQSPAGVEVDHINRDRLDNRRENLRVASHRENNQNRSSQSTQLTSVTGVRGVAFESGRAKPYRALVYSGGRRVFSRYFATVEEATSAVIEARRALLPYSQEAR